jgi:hypothetical protein
MLPQAPPRRRRLAMADLTAEARAEACVAELWPGKSARAQNRDLIAEYIRAAAAQAHAEGRAEGLEEAARLFEAKAAELRKSNYPPTNLAAYEYDDHADSPRPPRRPTLRGRDRSDEGGDVSVKKRKKRLDESRRASLFGLRMPARSRGREGEVSDAARQHPAGTCPREGARGALPGLRG